jgi:hypothetical protein
MRREKVRAAEGRILLRTNCRRLNITQSLPKADKIERSEKKVKEYSFIIEQSEKTK